MSAAEPAAVRVPVGGEALVAYGLALVRKSMLWHPDTCRWEDAGARRRRQTLQTRCEGCASLFRLHVCIVCRMHRLKALSCTTSMFYIPSYP